MTRRGQAFENFVVKGENTGNQHFLLFPTMFLKPIEYKNLKFSYISFFVCKSFEFGPVQNFLVW